MNFPSEYSTLSLASEVPVDSFDVITVMDGPGVNGLERYWLGFFDEDLHDDDGSILARPVGHHLLPHPMSLPEIEEWALENLSIPKEALATCEANFGRSQRTSEA